MLIAVACGSVVTPGTARDVPFDLVATTQLSAYEGDAAVMVGTTEATRARIAQLVAGTASANGRAVIAVLQGSQRTGGYAVRVDGIERDGDRLIVHATFTEPPAGAIVTQVLTSPAQVVSIDLADAAGARQAVVLDARGAERARVDIG